MSEKITVEKAEAICKKVMSILIDEEKLGIQDLRKVVGMMLSGIHTAVLNEADEKDRENLVMWCLSSVDAIIKCIEHDIEKLGIEGISVKRTVIDEEKEEDEPKQ